MKKRIAIFASGTGTNAENIIHFFTSHPLAEVVLVLCNSPNADVLKKATDLGVKTVLFNRNDFYESQKVASTLSDDNIDLIVLAGFLWLFPDTILKNYPNKVINIHPALLPKYGGKGMYGMHIHRAVVENKERETGITIHYVNAVYDEGEIIFQAKTAVSDSDTPELVAQKIAQLEKKYFPIVIEKIIAS
ncbi:MAG TPA: phosphoribosylglycinamide formyltransferase [Flavobacteriaceae bacterium]|nr:phosphoribosylglycinamide formyltransferase [Flavobacteriaceae bacterium]